MERVKPGLNALSILGLLFTLIVMFSLKGDLILSRPLIVVEMAIPMAIFFVVMFFVVLFVGCAPALQLQRRRGGRFQLDRARLRDRHRHRDHRLLADRGAGDRGRAR